MSRVGISGNAKKDMRSGTDMPKLGKFAVYNGREYALSVDSEENYEISTKNKELAEPAFCFSEESGIYKKMVSADELELVYDRKAFIVLGETVLSVTKEYNNCYYAQTSDKKAAKIFGMDSIDSKRFGKFFPKYGVKLVERTEYCKISAGALKDKEGHFAVYGGKEYSWLVLDQRTVPEEYEDLKGKNQIIFTTDEKDADGTFYREEYLAVEYARIGREKILVLKKDGDRCTIGTKKKELAKKLGLKKMDGGFYGAEKSLSELDIEEDIVCRSRARSNMFREEYMYRRALNFFSDDTELIAAYYDGWADGIFWKPLSVSEIEAGYRVSLFAFDGGKMQRITAAEGEIKLEAGTEEKVFVEKEHYISPKLSESGRYVIYKENEYKLSDGNGRKCMLLTKDKALADSTFKENKVTGVFSKLIDAEELSGMYTLTDYVDIKGERFFIYGGDSENYFIELHESFFLDALRMNFGQEIEDGSEYMIPRNKIGSTWGTAFVRDVVYTDEPALLLKKRRNYAQYRGREYIITGDMRRSGTLITRNAEIADGSFDERYGKGIFSKTVDINELEKIYYVMRYAFVNGEKLSVIGENVDSFTLYTSDEAVAGKLSLGRIDGYGYGGKFSKFEVDVMKKINNMNYKPVEGNF